MQAECPHCQTIFKLTEQQLQVAGGMVRCGMCQRVFNALELGTNDNALSIDDFVTPVSEIAGTSPEHDVDIANTDDINITVTYKDKLDPEENKPACERLEPVDPVSSEEYRFSEKNSNTDTLFENTSKKIIPDQFRIPEISQPYSAWRDISWVAAILLLTGCLMLQITWFNRNELITDQQIGPWILKLCDNIDCSLLSLRNPDQIEMLNRNVYSHPVSESALMVSVTMINHAKFAQPYPNVRIDFSDTRGNTITSRTFTPEEYLQLPTDNIRLIDSGASADFGLEIQDPGPEAMTYEFAFL